MSDPEQIDGVDCVSRDALGSTRIVVSAQVSLYVYDEGDPDQVYIEPANCEGEEVRIPADDLRRLRRELAVAEEAREAERERYDSKGTGVTEVFFGP